MSTKTIIEIDHDHLEGAVEQFAALVLQLGGSLIQRDLKTNAGQPVRYSDAITIYAQRHHSKSVSVQATTNV